MGDPSRWRRSGGSPCDVPGGGGAEGCRGRFRNESARRPKEADPGINGGD